MSLGLTGVEAGRRLKEFGYNELPSAGSKSILHIALEVIKEPMFLLLISCGTLYIILGNMTEGIILLSTIFIIIGITFLQYRKTERALEALRKLSAPRVLVLRDGLETRIPGREVVPGDIIILHEGDRIAADATLSESVNLSVDESVLTGESMPVNKHHNETGNLLFSGTLVIRGKAMAIVTATGINARLGKIATSLKELKDEPTRLQSEMKILIRRLSVIGIFISITVVISYYLVRGNFLLSLLTGLSASMAILPEEFPVVLTVFLALGAWRLSRKNVLTRKHSAIETLGSATVLCSDKTGTITQNKMEVVAVYNGDTIVYKDLYHQNIDSVTGIVTTVQRATQQNSADPMEKAIHKLYEELNMAAIDDQVLLKEYPLSHDLLAMTRVLEHPQENMISVSAKGAPEAIFELCKMTGPELHKHMQAVNEMAVKGYRIIGVAAATHTENTFPEKQAHFDFQFTGLIALEDPIRTEVPSAIKECTNAGIRVIMITGDYPATAISIAVQAGFEKQVVASGDELADMSDDELKEKIKNINIFARVTPEQKLRIVKALKANGEIVAMTGDGVNDAPALKAADIGVAMGIKGTDVAREASSLVLLDDNFASIVAAVRLGRRIYDNLQKAMSYILAIHIPIIGLTLLPSFAASLPVFLLPLHIVFMELIIDPVCSVAFESELEETNIMSRPPRSANSRFFGIRRMAYSIFQGLLLMCSVLIVYFLSIHEGHTEGEVRAIAFSSLIIGNIFLILTNLSKTRYALQVLAEGNKALIIIVSAAVILLASTIFVPALQSVFSFNFPGYKHFISSLTASVLMVTILELIKYFRNRSTKH